jgi:putative FmdB family regulatory protein
MPIYEFECRPCGCRFEKLLRIGAEAVVHCPSCGAADVGKRPSAFGIGGGANRVKSAGSGCATCSAKSCSTCS